MNRIDRMSFISRHPVDPVTPSPRGILRHHASTAGDDATRRGRGMAQSRALLYIQLSPPAGPAGDTTAFDAWYDEHQARRAEMPGFLNVSRYRRVEPAGDAGPLYLALYELT